MKYLDLARIFSHIIILPDHINHIRQYIKAMDICKKMDIDPSLSTFRQVCTLNLLEKNIPDEMETEKGFF